MIWFWWHQTTCNSNKIVRARLHCRHFCVFSVGLSVFFWVLGFIQWLYPLHDSCRTEKQKGISSLLQHLKLFTGLAVELPAVKGWTPASSRKTRGGGLQLTAWRREGAGAAAAWPGAATPSPPWCSWRRRWPGRGSFLAVPDRWSRGFHPLKIWIESFQLFQCKNW